jgi:hypothetical protein
MEAVMNHIWKLPFGILSNSNEKWPTDRIAIGIQPLSMNVCKVGTSLCHTTKYSPRWLL